MPQPTPFVLAAALLLLLPLFAYGFQRRKTISRTHRLPAWFRLTAPGLLVVPYLLVNAGAVHLFWALLYLTLPIAVALLLRHAAHVDPEQNGSWPDFLVLAALGLAVDLRWLESAWPPHLAVFGKMLLLDAGLWGFFTVRHLHGSGLDLRLDLGDLRRGVVNFLLYAPIAIGLGLSLGFLHLHRSTPDPVVAALTPIYTFFFVALPEELFFRGWLQNLLERRLGPNGALLVTSVLFGLSHFNKRAAHFNWRYVLLATIAGFFYGRSWRGRGGRNHHRVGASALTHTLVDTAWSLFLR